MYGKSANENRWTIIALISLVILLPHTAFSQKQRLPESKINDLSKKSLFINIIKDGSVTGRATGFLVLWKNRPYLITNWHVVTGHHPLDPLQYAEKRRPDSLRIIFHAWSTGVWIKGGGEAIFDTSGNPRYFEHPDKWVDIVALPIANFDTTLLKLHYFDLSLRNSNLIPEVGMPVFIIGFIEGLTGPGVFPIWKAGHIASEPSLKYRGNEAFLIDATTRGGMSGSPVVLKQKNCTTGKDDIVFLGVYAGRLSQNSEIGLVWKPQNIMAILETIK
ncbi:MAG: trypsin-like peptidase domain-containing protein [Chitinispirillaceae bacterium]|nr:trypsin-like peptidase domain-containing protein [Chitinispirillaceae bacterium]